MDKEVYLITSHNSRIQCFLNEIVNQPAGSEKIRLKNCAIVRIEFYDTISVKMLYSGELEDSEKDKVFKYPYYVTSEDLLKPSDGASEQSEQSEQYSEAYGKSAFPYGASEVSGGGGLKSYFFGKSKTPATEEPAQKVSREQSELQALYSQAYEKSTLPYGAHWVSGGGLKSFFLGKSKTQAQKVSREQKLEFDIVEPAEVEAILGETKLNLQKIRDARLRRIKRAELMKQIQVPGQTEAVMRKLSADIQSITPDTLYKPVVFYIIRHAQALHNETKMRPTTDTELTLKGQQQAKRAGEAFLKILENYNEIPELLLVSDLKRTHQTLKHIIFNALIKARDRKPKQSPLYETLFALNKQPFVILPCASEIAQVAHDGKCDQKNADARFYKKLALENYSRCSADSITRKSDRTCIVEDTHKLIWDYYLFFYGNAVRSERFETITRGMNDGNRKRCRDTNMVRNVFGFLTYIENNGDRPAGVPRMDDPYKESVIGGTRKKRKTRRKKSRSR